MSPIEMYLRSYIRGRRIVAVLRAACWALSFALVWILLSRLAWNAMPKSAAILGGMIMIRPLSFLFRRYEWVKAAIEIEAAQPAFDQRLITVVSQQYNSTLTDQLLAEVEPMIKQKTARSLVPLQPLTWPGMSLLAAGLLCYFTSRHR